jgi:hypothetical protein
LLLKRGWREGALVWAAVNHLGTGYGLKLGKRDMSRSQSVFGAVGYPTGISGKRERSFHLHRNTHWDRIGRFTSAKPRKMVKWHSARTSSGNRAYCKLTKVAA